MEYGYEWKDEYGHLHRVLFGPTISAAIRAAAEEDAERYGIDTYDAVNIIINGMVAAEIAEEAKTEIKTTRGRKKPVLDVEPDGFFTE